MDQKQWEQRLDRAADKVSEVVGEGVRVLEDAFEKGKQTLQDEMDARRGPAAATGASGATGDTGTVPGTAGPAAGTGSGSKGSPRMGLMLVGLGIVWLLHTLGILDQPIFPILLIILGVYFIVRSK
jgi:hypothetical protein